jgi:hypothetical protein
VDAHLGLLRGQFLANSLGRASDGHPEEVPELRVMFEPHRSDQNYHNVACSKLADTRELRRARTLYRALYWWRFDRKTSAEALKFICREIAHWIEEDRAIGREPPPRMNFEQDRGHQRKKLPGPKVPEK